MTNLWQISELYLSILKLEFKCEGIDTGTHTDVFVRIEDEVKHVFSDRKCDLANWFDNGPCFAS